MTKQQQHGWSFVFFFQLKIMASWCGYCRSSVTRYLLLLLLLFLARHRTARLAFFSSKSSNFSQLSKRFCWDSFLLSFFFCVYVCVCEKSNVETRDDVDDA